MLGRAPVRTFGLHLREDAGVIRSLSPKCPYCEKCELAFDFQAGELVFNPDAARPQACEHLVYLHGHFAQPSPEGQEILSFFWRHPVIEADPDLAYRMDWIDFIQGSGAVYPHLDDSTPFTLRWLLPVSKQLLNTGELGAMALWAVSPAAFLAACRELVAG